MSLPNPIVLLDARARYVHPAFQMTRASTKTVWDSAGRLVTVPANALGWDHDPATGQARGYLSEPQATNLFLHSNDLTQGVWAGTGATITPDAITGPDGNGMAKLVEDSANGVHRAMQTITIADGATIVTQAVAKAEERSTMQIFILNPASAGNNVLANFDLNNGSVLNDREANDGELVGHGISDLGGGFYHAWLAAKIGAGATSFRAEFRVLDDNGDTNYTGDGTSGLYLGYCQAEEGDYPTSYIETGAATATRAGDSLIDPNVGNQPWWSSARGTVLIDVGLVGAAIPGDVLCINNHDIAFRWGSMSGDLTLLSAIALNGRLLKADKVPGRHLLAVTWDEDRLVVAVDGNISVDGPVSGALPPDPAVGLGTRTSSGAVGGGSFRRAVYYPARLSNADLQSMTAIQE